MRLLNLFLMVTVVAAVATTTGCEKMGTDDPEFTLRWGVVDNHLEAGFRSSLTLVNHGSEPLRGDWTIFFNFLRVVDSESVTPPLAIDHVNGDLYRLTPRAGFEELASGGSVTVEFLAQAWAVSVTDGPAGAYLVRGDAQSGAALITPVDIEIEPFVSERQTDRGPNDNRPVLTPELEFHRNLSAPTLEAADIVPVTPTPLSIKQLEGEVELASGVPVSVAAGLEKEGEMLARQFAERLSIHNVRQARPSEEPLVRLSVTDASVERIAGEAYTLTVSPDDGIRIVGAGRAGVFYGIQTLISLVTPADYGNGRAVVSAVRIEDAPRFGYRGMHLDVARNFQSKASVLKLLDLMAYYKLNRFHFHLTDDEGWRLEIDGLPELTSVGAFRGHTTTEKDHLIPSFGSGPWPDPQLSNGSGYYTRSDFIEILRYARERHIEVIPEIDVPGHARAAIVAMKARHDRLLEEGDEAAATRFLLTHPDDQSTYQSVQHWNDNVIDVCMPSTYDFLRHVIADVVGMYEEAGARLTTIHTGGDEVPIGVWEGSPACDALSESEGDLDLPSLFVERIHAIVSEHGLTTAGWEEVALRISADHTVKEPDPARLGKGIRPYVWNSIWGAGSESLAYELANAGFEIVLSSASNLYFDLAYAKHPDEPGYYWAGYVEAKKPFELEPYDLYRSGKENLMGNPIAPSRYANMEKLTDEGRSNILGIQGQLWGENAKGVEIMEYLAFPRMIVLAERAWAKRPEWSERQTMAERDAGLDQAWAEFANRLGARELPKLDKYAGGVKYRIPPPGALISEGIMQANVAHPGLTIRYTLDDSSPGPTSPVYEGPVEVSGPVRLRTFDTRDRGSREVRVDVASQ